MKCPSLAWNLHSSARLELEKSGSGSSLISTLDNNHKIMMIPATERSLKCPCQKKSTLFQLVTSEPNPNPFFYSTFIGTYHLHIVSKTLARLVSRHIPGLSQAGWLGGWAQAPHQFLAEQLTLSQPGGQIMPTLVLRAPLIFRPCDGPK